MKLKQMFLAGTAFLGASCSPLKQEEPSCVADAGIGAFTEFGEYRPELTDVSGRVNDMVTVQLKEDPTCVAELPSGVKSQVSLTLQEPDCPADLSPAEKSALGKGE